MLPVAVASTLQFLLAATFVVIPIIARRHGDRAQVAAQREVARQGLPVAVLDEHHVRFAETSREMLFPLAIAALLTALAALDLAGLEAGRTLTWIMQPVVLIGGGFVTAAQVFATRYTQAVFQKSPDPRARTLDAHAMIDAAAAEFPAVLRPLQILRFALATLGSALVIAFLATPTAGAYFG